MFRSHVHAVLASALCLITVAAAKGADFPTFQQERAAIQTKLKARVPATRLEGIQRLADFAFEDSARLLVQFGLKDEAEINRRAAYDALMTINRSQEVCDFLVEQLNIESRKTSPDSISPVYMAVLLSSDLNNIGRSSQRFLDEQLVNNKDGGSFLALVCDALGYHGSRTDVPALEKIARTKLFSTHFVVRRAAIQGLSAIPHADAVDAMVRLLPTVEGEARGDLVEQLALITKRKLASDQEWTDWWKENKATFVFPDMPPKPAQRQLVGLDNYSTGHYYGLPLYAQRMVFVLDASGSMNGPRIVAAKRELIGVVQGLRSRTYFGILVYNDDVGWWKKELVEATTANKADAIRFVNAIQVGARTASYDALDAAFYFDAESIYFLSDGAPTAGRIVNPPDIVAAISKQNRGRRESIYTIGIGPGEKGSPFEVFLSKLAEENYGVYKRVDE
jgi:hypothetical protein